MLERMTGGDNGQSEGWVDTQWTLLCSGPLVAGVR